MGERPQQALWRSLFSPLQASLCPFFSELTTQRTLGVPGHRGCEWGGSGEPLAFKEPAPGPPKFSSRSPHVLVLHLQGCHSVPGDLGLHLTVGMLTLPAPKDGERRRVWCPRRAHGKYNAKPIHLSSSYRERVFHL